MTSKPTGVADPIGNLMLAATSLKRIMQNSHSGTSSTSTSTTSTLNQRPLFKLTPQRGVVTPPVNPNSGTPTPSQSVKSSSVVQSPVTTNSRVSVVRSQNSAASSSSPSPVGSVSNGHNSVTIPVPNIKTYLTPKSSSGQAETQPVKTPSPIVVVKERPAAIVNSSFQALSAVNKTVITSPKRDTNHSSTTPLNATTKSVVVETPSSTPPKATPVAVKTDKLPSSSTNTNNKSGSNNSSEVGQSSNSTQTPQTITTMSSLVTPNQVLSISTANKQSRIKPKSTHMFITRPFIWADYLKALGAIVAPEGYFKQSTEVMINEFDKDMKLEARDPQARNSWCLASVQSKLGPRIRLRFESAGTNNDFWELIDSDSIRPYGSPVHHLDGDVRGPPVSFTRNLSSYTKFVERIVCRDDIKLAPDSCFKSGPKAPPSNMFKVGMKLEAIDRKNPDLICPATVTSVRGEFVNIEFDGWHSGAFQCRYQSREIFPVGWCTRNQHPLQPPPNWETMDLLAPNPVKKVSPGKSAKTTTDHYVETSSISPIHRNGINSTGVSSTKSSVSTSSSLPTSTVPANDDEVIVDIVETDPEKSIKRKKAAKKKERRDSNEESDAKRLKRERKKLLESMNAASPLECLKKAKEMRDVFAFPEFDRTCDKGPSQVSPPKTNLCPQADSHLMSNPKSDKSKAFKSTSQISSTVESPAEVKKDSKSVEKLSDSSTISDNQQSDITMRDIRQKKPISSWTTKDVVQALSSDSTLQPHLKTFLDHEIDGRAFVELTTEHMIRYMDLKLGPILKINTIMGSHAEFNESSWTMNETCRKSIPEALKSMPLSAWTVDDVLNALNTDPSLTPYLEVFRYHEIDGRAFEPLDIKIMMQHMGLKLGPVLKINSLMSTFKSSA